MRGKFLLLLYLAISTLSGQTVSNTFLIDLGPNNTTDGNPTISPDIFGNHWANVTNPVATSIKVGLITSSGDNSDFSINVSSPLSKNGINHGGLLDPDSLLLSEYAVGSATQDYFFTASEGALVISNLDLTNAYSFRFFASRNHPENRITRFDLIGANSSQLSSQSSGEGIGSSGSDANDSILAESDFIFPDVNGEIRIGISVELGSFAYINFLEMSEYNDVELVQVESIEIESEDLSVNSGFIQLKANVLPTDATVKAVEWHVSDTDLAYITDEGKLYGYTNGEVIVTAKSKQINSEVFSTAVIEISNQESRKMLIDFGPEDMVNGIATTEVQGGNAWSNLTSSEIENGEVHLKFSNGDSSSATVKVSQRMLKNGFISEGFSELPISLGDFNVESVLEDYFSTQNSGEITFSGLSLDNGYRFDIVGSHPSTGERFSRYTLNGLNNSSGILQTSGANFEQSGIYANDSNFFTSDVIFPNDQGEITLTVSVSSGQFAYLNAVRITEYLDVEICPNRDQFGIAVMGSSVARGQGAPGDRGYAYQYGELLGTRAENGEGKDWDLTNISIGGNNTIKVLERWQRDLVPLCDQYVIYGLSLGNEGIANNGQAAFDQFRDNLIVLVNQAREIGIEPIIMNTYTREDFGPTEYQFIKDMNLLIHEWDLPSINLLGAIDNGMGNWAEGYQQDFGHPNQVGHLEFFYAMVPSLFDALDEGKMIPTYQQTEMVEIGGDADNYLVLTPEHVLHPFTLHMDLKVKDEAKVITFESNGVEKVLKVNKDLQIVYLSSSVDSIVSPLALSSDDVNSITLSHYYAMGKTFVYVNGVMLNESISENLEVKEFVFGDRELNREIEIGNLLFYRSGMNQDEVTKLSEKVLLKSSLEIYSPLNRNGVDLLENLAQSTNELDLAFFSSTGEVNRTKEELLIYPSPVNDLVHVKWEQVPLDLISVYNSNGQRVINSKSSSIGITQLPPGLYYVQTLVEGDIKTGRFVKL